MSGNISEEVRPLLERCLVVIFKEKKHRKSDEYCQDVVTVTKDVEANQGENPEYTTTVHCNEKGAKTDDNARENSQHKQPQDGKELYEEFVNQNKGCFWDPHLEESLNNIQVLGYIYPHILLLGGRDIYLDTVRGAWSRRVLQAPPAFSIYRVGEIGQMNMNIISQAQFTPLPEALCMIISDLNKQSSIATFEEIIKQLKKKYRGVHQPAEEVVYEALGTLLKERKVYHTGHGYHIITPELFAHLNHLNGCATLQDHRNSIFIPLTTSPMAEMCSIACQTEDVQNQLDLSIEKDEKPSSKSKKFERSNSLRESKKSNKDKKLAADGLSRSASVRLNDDKAKSLVKDINLKTSEVHQEKDKGEKTSLFNKLFGSKNKKKATYFAEGIEEDDIEKPTVEYATFSAQFPPPDIQWYEAQSKAALLFQKPLTNKYPVSRSNTFHYLQKPPMVDAEAQSDIFDNSDFNACPIHKSKTLPENISGFTEVVHNHTQQKSSSSHSQDSRYSPAEFQCTSRNFADLKTLSNSKRHKKHREKRRSRQEMNENNLDTIPYMDQTNSDNYGKHMESNARLKSKRSSTLHSNRTPEAIYEDIGEFQRTSHNEGIHQGPSDINPVSNNKLDHSHSSGNSNDQDISPSSNQVKNSSHKNKIYRKYKEMYNNCTNPCDDNDVSFEHNNKLPLKNVAFSKSRDSGVNCIGLTELQPCITVPLSEISNSLNCSAEVEHPYIITQPQTYHVNQSKLNFIHNDTKNAKSFRTRSQSADAVGRKRANIIVHQAEVHRMAVNDKKENFDHNLHEDSGFNSPKGYITSQSLEFRGNQRSAQRRDLLSQSYHNNFNNTNEIGKERSKDMSNLSNSFLDTEKSVHLPRLSDNIVYKETDLDHPSLDYSIREGSPSQIEEVDDSRRGFQLLSPEESKAAYGSRDIFRNKIEVKERKVKHRERPRSSRDEKYQGHNVHIKDQHSHHGFMHNNNGAQNRKHSGSNMNSERQVIGKGVQNKNRKTDFEVVGVI